MFPVQEPTLFVSRYQEGSFDSKSDKSPIISGPRAEMVSSSSDCAPVLRTTKGRKNDFFARYVVNDEGPETKAAKYVITGDENRIF
jgi:hypothetical protein